MNATEIFLAVLIILGAANLFMTVVANLMESTARVRRAGNERARKSSMEG